MVLRATNIYKKFGDLEILKGVNLGVEKGEVVSIIGKSGSGKSTLLHILGTLDTPTNGEIEINGTKISQMSSKSLADFRNKHIGFVFQFHHLLPEFTALENVMIPALIGKKNVKEAEKGALQLLDYLGLSHRLSHKPAALSGGEQQRVAVARALINKPAVIFADEPTGNLDTSASADFHRLIKKLSTEQGQTFVVVTHNVELAALSDRCLEMRDGLLVGQNELPR